jgi:hypothetical protein
VVPDGDMCRHATGQRLHVRIPHVPQEVVAHLKGVKKGSKGGQKGVKRGSNGGQKGVKRGSNGGREGIHVRVPHVVQEVVAHLKGVKRVSGGGQEGDRRGSGGGQKGVIFFFFLNGG